MPLEFGSEHRRSEPKFFRKSYLVRCASNWCEWVNNRFHRCREQIFNWCFPLQLSVQDRWRQSVRASRMSTSPDKDSANVRELAENWIRWGKSVSGWTYSEMLQGLSSFSEILRIMQNVMGCPYSNQRYCVLSIFQQHRHFWGRQECVTTWDTSKQLLAIDSGWVDSLLVRDCIVPKCNGSHHQ